MRADLKQLGMMRRRYSLRCITTYRIICSYYQIAKRVVSLLARCLISTIQKHKYSIEEINKNFSIDAKKPCYMQKQKAP